MQRAEALWRCLGWSRVTCFPISIFPLIIVSPWFHLGTWLLGHRLTTLLALVLQIFRLVGFQWKPRVQIFGHLLGHTCFALVPSCWLEQGKATWLAWVPRWLGTCFDFFFSYKRNMNSLFMTLCYSAYTQYPKYRDGVTCIGKAIVSAIRKTQVQSPHFPPTEHVFPKVKEWQ